MPGPQLLQRKFVEGPFPQLGRQKKGKGGIREELLGSDDEKGDLPDDHRVRTMRGAQGDEEATHSCQMAWQEGLGSALLKW